MELNEKTLKKIMTEQRKEYERYLGALSEDTQEKFNAIIKQFGVFNDKLDSHTRILDSHTEILDSHTEILDSHTKRLDSHTEMIGSIKEDVETINDSIETINSKLDSHSEILTSTKEAVEIIKTDIEFIKGGLRKKVDYEEFVELEKRMSLLESKMAN